MTRIALLAPLLALLPSFSDRLTTFLFDLRMAIGRYGKREQDALTAALQHRLHRLSLRLQRLLALLAAGGRPRQWPSRPGRAPRPRAARLPYERKGGILREVASLGNFHHDLYNLLLQPDIVELMAAEPAIGRILRPLCHMLGLPKPGVRKPAPKPARPSVTPAPPPHRIEPDFLPPLGLIIPRSYFGS